MNQKLLHFTSALFATIMWEFAFMNVIIHYLGRGTGCKLLVIGCSYVVYCLYYKFILKKFSYEKS